MKIKNMFFRKIIFTFGLTAMLLGCGTLPASGPYSKNIHTSDKVNIKISTADRGTEKFRYAVAEIDTNLINYLSDYSVESAQNEDWPANTPAEKITVNVGDTIEVSIFESQAGGLFIPEGSSVRPGNFVSLPAQTIDFSGFITVPYAGKIKAAGRTTEEISADIVTKLENKAIEPQVVVSFSGRNGAEVSVIGDVNNARRLSLGFNQYKILDAIASAGGPVSPGYETKVSLQRAGEEYKIQFDQLVDDSAKNIYAEINDIIYLYREPETFIAYGAVQNPGSIPFGKSNLMLSEALGLTRGLVDGQADPAEVYIYRQKKYPYFKKATEVETKLSSVSTTITASDLAYSLETEEGVKPSFKIMSKVGAATEKKKAVKIVKDQVVASENVKTPSKIQSIIKKPSFFRFKNSDKADNNAFDNQRPPAINSNTQAPTSTKVKTEVNTATETVVTTKNKNIVDVVEPTPKPSIFSRMKLPTLSAPQNAEKETTPSFKMISKVGAEAAEETTATAVKKVTKEAATPANTFDVVEPNQKPSFFSKWKLPSFSASPQEAEEIAPSFKATSKIGANTVTQTVTEEAVVQETIAKEVEAVKAIEPKAVSQNTPSVISSDIPAEIPMATKVLEEPAVPTTRLMKRVEPEIQTEIVQVPTEAKEAAPVVQSAQPAFSITESTATEAGDIPKSTLTNVLSTPNVNQVEEVVETRQVVSNDGDVALIFKLNMRDPQSFFLAQNFKMEDQDIVYVANAESVELSKFLNIIGISSTTTNNTTSVRDGF